MANIVDPLDLSYAAGLIDGEGTIGITELQPGDGKRRDGRRYRKSPQHRIYVAVTMTEEVAIGWMHLTFGGHLQRLRARQSNHKPTFRWSLASVSAAEFCEQITPYLKVKRQQAEIAARFYRERQSSRRFHSSQGVPGDELALRRAAVAEIRKLNQRGAAVA